MATNIGRVEFIADLNGDRIPAQARKLGRQIADEGSRSGKEFGDNFDTEFERSLTATGRKAAAAMREAGRMGGESFTDDFEDAVKSRSRNIQKTLAGTLADKDALAKSFEGFETVTGAIEHYERELKAAGESVDSHADSLLEAADAEEKRRTELERSTEAMRNIAVEQEKVAAQIDRLNRLSRDTSAIRQTAIDKDITYTQVTANMRAEMEKLQKQGDVNLTQVLRHNDALERSIEIIEDEDARAAQAAQDRIDRIARQDAADQRLADNDAQRARDRLDRIARQEKADKEATQRQIERAERTVQAAVDKANRIKAAEDKENESHLGSVSVLDKITGAWRRMDGTVKLVIVSIVAAADEVAVLGSALGAGVLAVGGALSAVAVGGIGLVGLFSQLNQEIEDAPIALRNAITEYQNLGGAFHDVSNIIAQSAVASMGDGFKDLRENILDLSPALGGVGDMLGELIEDFGTTTKQGGKAFQVINDAVIIGTGNFDSLARTAGQFGVALVRSLNRSQPLVEDLLGWVDRLVTQFDVFTQSSGFDDWISDAQAVFGSFGGLLDEVGRSLNDLASPEAVDRTIAFIDNLTAFTPHLETLLDVMGELDAFGLLADALASFGEALAPLAEPTRRLMESLNELISLNIDAFANILSGAAPIIGAVFDTISGFIDDVPPSTVQAVAGAIVTLGLAIGTMNAVIGVSAAIKFFKGFTVQAEKLGPAAGIAAKGISGLAKAAGLVGVVTVSVGLLTSAFKAITGAADSVPPSVDAILNSMRANGGLDSAFTSAGETANTFAEAIHAVSSGSFDAGAMRFNEMIGGLIGLKTAVGDARDGLAALDETLAAQVAGGEAEAAAASWEEMTRISEEQGVSVEELTKKFPEYAAALATADAASASSTEGFEGIGTAADNSVRSIEDLADAVRGYGDAQVGLAGSQIQFNEAILGAGEALTDNGATLANNTKEGLANQQALLDIADAAKDYAAQTKESTGSTELMNDQIEAGRVALVEAAKGFGMTATDAETYATKLGLVSDGSQEMKDKEIAAHAELVNTLEQFGLNAEEAEEYADKLMEIPSEHATDVALLGAEKAKGDAEAVKRSIDNITSKTVTITTKFTTSGQPIYQGGGGNYLYARGGIADQPTAGIFGEAGREALVPLNRPLMQVDPSVRALSAYAQGLPMPGGGGGGGSGAGNGPSSTSRVVNISPGAIVVQGSMAPETSATLVVNRIAERIAG